MLLSTSRQVLTYFVVTLVAVLVQSAYIFRASLTMGDSTGVTQLCAASAKGGKVAATSSQMVTTAACPNSGPCSITRDCVGLKPYACTRENPCTPCPDVSTADDAGCRACSESANNGDCGFIEGVGCVKISSSRTRARRAHANSPTPLPLSAPTARAPTASCAGARAAARTRPADSKMPSFEDDAHRAELCAHAPRELWREADVARGRELQERRRSVRRQLLFLF
jgi:hypothetical protein